MSKPANRERGEVSLANAGDGVILRFSNEAMERLYSELGDQYVDEVIRKTGAANPKVFKTVLECMIEGEYIIEDRPWGYSWNELNELILDAIFLALHKRTFKEQQEFLDKEADKAFDEAKDNPRKAAALFSKLYAELGLPQDSDLGKSGNARRKK
jgi:hypothetical protein